MQKVIKEYNRKRNGGTDRNATTHNTLQNVAKGTVIIFIGTIVGLLLAFVSRILFARNFSSDQYGIFSFCIALLSIFTVVGTIGLGEGSTRQIAYYNGKKQVKKIQFIIRWSIAFGIISGIGVSLFVFVYSDVIAIKIFNISTLSLPLKIVSLAIPFSIQTMIISSIFRGFKRVKEKVFFLDFIRPLLFPILLVPVILLGKSFEWGILAYALSSIITCVIFIIYFILKKPISLKVSAKSKGTQIGKKLLIFSLPLLLVAILSQVMSWTDTLMLGYFKTPDIVGLYNVASPLARFITTALAAMLFIYTPVVSDLYARNKDDEMRRSYAVLTKWICGITLPLALTFVLFPGLVLNFFFGSEYILAALVLQILAIGFFINNLMGPNGATLTAMGKTKFLMMATLIAAGLNVTLNALLIPKYGITGAAIATVTAIISINIIRSVRLYSISKIHSFEKNILKPIILSVILVFAIYLIANEFLTITVWTLPIIFIFFHNYIWVFTICYKKF